MQIFPEMHIFILDFSKAETIFQADLLLIKKEIVQLSKTTKIFIIEIIDCLDKGNFDDFELNELISDYENTYYCSIYGYNPE